MLRYPEQCSMIALYHYRDSLFLFFMCKRTLFIFFNYFNQVEGEAGEPSFRRLVLRSVAHIIRLYSSSLITECEVRFYFLFHPSHRTHKFKLLQKWSVQMSFFGWVWGAGGVVNCTMYNVILRDFYECIQSFQTEI
jgi:hypothetical protein